MERPEVEITEADKDAMIENLRSQKATWEAADRKSAEGDRVTVDFDGSLKGEPIEGGKGTDVPVVLGQGQMLPDFEKGLTGVSAGDSTQIKVKFPKDYHAEELQGKKVDFAITIKSVEEQVLPPLDDSLAEMFGVTERGLEQLRIEVAENMGVLEHIPVSDHFPEPRFVHEMIMLAVDLARPRLSRRRGDRERDLRIPVAQLTGERRLARA